MFSILQTRTVPTIKVEMNRKKVYIHSKYDPINEVKYWVEKVSENINSKENIIVIGLGAGYHITELAQKYRQSITVIEFNDAFYEWFMKSPFNIELKGYKNVKIKLFSQMSTNERNQIFTSISLSNLLIHKSGLDLIPEEFYGIKIALEDINMQQYSLQAQISNLNKNFEKNQLLNDVSIKDFFNRYKGKPMILVSAGPSLDKQLPLLKKIHNEGFFVIGAVATAIKPLIQFGITPNFFMIIDANPETYNQLTNVELSIPLFYLSTAYHETILLHKGTRYIVYQEGFYEAERVASEKGENLIKTGGSVATALLDLMVFFGGTSIALVGQDLAYTNGLSHATATHDQKVISETHNSIEVLNYDQSGVILTAQNLNLYKKWFESYSIKHPELNLYNCTEGGAYIRNWKHISLYEYYINPNKKRGSNI